MPTTSFAAEFQNYRNIFTTSTYLQKTREKQEHIQVQLDQENTGSHQNWKGEDMSEKTPQQHMLGSPLTHKF